MKSFISKYAVKVKSDIITTATMLLLPLAAATMASCDDQLDIVPKGKTTLETVSELETLLNQEYSMGKGASDDLGVICNECYGAFESVPEILGQPNTVKYANYTYDESVDRAMMTGQDERYEAFYKYINYMNVVISKMDDARDSDGKNKQQLVAEARVIRAYLHWLLVNIHAKQYDAATAANEGGIAYVDNTDVSQPKTKLTLEETYQRILADCSDDVIALLPDHNSNVERADKAFANGVRAHVLMQMKRYAEALPYAQASLKYNGTVQDRSKIMETFSWDLTEADASNLLFIRGGTRVCPTFVSVSPETFALFEPGDYVVNYDMGGWNTMYGEMFSGISGSACYSGWNIMQNVYGLTSDRMYYVAAECLIRTGKTREGLELVDRVRMSRVEDAEHFAQDNLSEQEAMALMQPAKWIECIATYENFFDCKRWNTEADYKRTITRDYGEYGKFSIAPDSKLWVIPFPQNVTRTNASMTQNY